MSLVRWLQMKSGIAGSCAALWLAQPTTVIAVEHLVATVPQFNAAVSAAQPGDTIILTNQVWTNADLLFKKNGTPSLPITLRAQTPGHVLLSGQSRLRIAGRWLIVDGLRFENGYYTNGGSAVVQFRETSTYLATNCVLSNCAIVNYSPPETAVDNKWVSLYGLSNRVENGFFKGKTNAGATLVVWLPSSPTNLANYHAVRRNLFGFRPALGENGGETLRVGDSATSFNISRTLVVENRFQTCNGEIETISNKSCENVYRYNTFDSCEGTLTLRHGNACDVYGNWFLGHGLPLTGGVRIIGEQHRVWNNYFAGLSGSGLRAALCLVNGVPNSALNEYFQVRHAQVLFNTFVGCSNNFVIGQTVTGGTLAPVDSTMANNLVRSTTGPLIRIVTTPTNFTWLANFFSSAIVGLTNAGISTADPWLERDADGLWRPRTNSPVRGVAISAFPWITDDFDGQERLPATDSGADQLSFQPISRRPLFADQVGPLWMRQAEPIRSVAVSNQVVVLTWDSLPAVKYRISFSSNFVHWADGPLIAGTGSATSWGDDGSQTGAPPLVQSQRYYRISLVP